MKGFKVIALFGVLILLSYFGVLFVESNREEVIIVFGTWRTASAPLGFVVMTSILIGMILGALLCSLEIIFLFFKNQSLVRRIRRYENQSPTENDPVSEIPEVEPSPKPVEPPEQPMP